MADRIWPGEGDKGLDAQRRRWGRAVGDGGVALQKSGSGKESLGRVVEKDIHILRRKRKKTGAEKREGW